MHTLHLYVLYDCVQGYEDTASVELRYINEIYYYDYEITECAVQGIFPPDSEIPKTC